MYNLISCVIYYLFIIKLMILIYIILLLFIETKIILITMKHPSQVNADLIWVRLTNGESPVDPEATFTPTSDLES